MPFYKIIDEYPGFEIGQIAEFNSPSRIADMNGNSMALPKGVLVLKKKEEKNDENKIDRRVDEPSAGGSTRINRVNGSTVNIEEGSNRDSKVRRKAGAKKISKKSR